VREAVTAAVSNVTAAAFYTRNGGKHWRRTLLVPLPRGTLIFDPVRLERPETGRLLADGPRAEVVCST
jgi:hypothetical protein